MYNKNNLKQIVSGYFYLPRQRLTFPGRHQPSIISSAVLNFRVRNGNGCVHRDIATELLNTILSSLSIQCLNSIYIIPNLPWLSPRPISITQLNTLLHLHL